MNRRANILYIANRLPWPPDKGDKIRTFHQIDRLAQRHNVYCACFVDSREDAARAGELRRWCREVRAIPWTRRQGMIRGLRSLARGECLTAAAYADAAMGQCIEAWCARVRFDVVIAFSTTVANYALAARAERRILDMCDVDSEKWRAYANDSRWPARWFYAREAGALRAFERTCMDAFDLTLVSSERERQTLDPEGTCQRLAVVSNGVRFEAGHEDAASCGPIVGFVGAMDYRPNVDGAVWLARQVWPRLRAEVPDAKLWIIGRNPARAVRALDRIEGIHVTGQVRDPGRYLARCRVAAAPLRIARGIPNKVLEAMAAGRPVVATPAVAEALEARDGREMLTSEDAGEFAAHIVKLCLDSGIARRVAAAGFAFVAERHRWPAILDEFERRVLGESSPRSEPARGLRPRVQAGMIVNAHRIPRASAMHAGVEA